MEFVVLVSGPAAASNSLLHGPALLVANNGPFSPKDDEALHRAIGGSKEEDASKIGTFGLGLKSIFHLCEAFLYVGIENSKRLAGVLNPWAGTGEDKDGEDPIHPDWNLIGGGDESFLQQAVDYLLGRSSNGLLLWIPLRQPEQLDRGSGGKPYGLATTCRAAGELEGWLKGSINPFVLLLAQCGYLRQIRASHVTHFEDLASRRTLGQVSRRDGDVWIGRYDDDLGCQKRPFQGTIDTSEERWHASGIEAVGSPELRKLRSRDNWPSSSQWADGRHKTVPRKALAHAAITVLRPEVKAAQRLGWRLRWAVFLPLDDDPQPGESDVMTSFGSHPAWEVVLHGYFWPSQDRRSIPGVTDKDAGESGMSDMRVRWNRAVQDELLLPLLPKALALAVDGVEQDAAARLLKGVIESNTIGNRQHTVVQREWLLPVITEEGVRWEAHKANALQVPAIPGWIHAPDDLRRKVFSAWSKTRKDVVVIDSNQPCLINRERAGGWTVEFVEQLLNSIPREIFRYPRWLEWTVRSIEYALGQMPDGNHAGAASIACWLSEALAEHALNRVSDSDRREDREALQEAWRDLCSKLPEPWLVPVPVESHPAVAALAAEEAFGEGLFPAPFCSDPERFSFAPDAVRLDRALRILGRQLQGPELSAYTRNASLLLAEALFRRRPDGPLDELETLSLFRVYRLPEDEESAWSAQQIMDKAKVNRVLVRAGTDCKRAVKDLAKALGENLWLVNAPTTAFGVNIPQSDTDGLVEVVLKARAFATAAEDRRAMVQRLARDLDHSDGTPLAVRALIAGQPSNVVGGDVELFYVLDAERQRALSIALRLSGQHWRAVKPELVDQIPTAQRQSLSIAPADTNAIFGLVEDGMAEATDGGELSDEEAQHLLMALHGPALTDQERWRRLPLHRCVDGKRRPIDVRMRRRNLSDSVPIPDALQGELQILDPDPEIAHLYEAVPFLDRNGVLRAMLEHVQPEQFASDIVESIRPAGRGDIELPQDRELRNTLKQRAWLPLCGGGGIAPEDLLIVPDELLDAIRKLGDGGALDKWLPQDVDALFWSTAGPVVREVLGSLRRSLQVQRITDALLPEELVTLAAGGYLLLPDSEQVDADLIRDALQVPLADAHQGWKLMSMVVQVLDVDLDAVTEEGGHAEAREKVVCLARALCGPVPPRIQAQMLHAVAAQEPAKDSLGGRVFRRLLCAFSKDDEFFGSVLQSMKLPTQDGNWHPAQEVARSEVGVARRHRVLSELRACLRLNDETPTPMPAEPGANAGGSQFEVLNAYLEPWRNKVQRQAVGAFLSVLGDGLSGNISELAQQWLGDDISLDFVRSNLDNRNWCAVSVWASPRIASGDVVVAVNVLGDSVEMNADAEADTLFSVDPVHRPQSMYSALRPLGNFWEISLRDVQPDGQTRQDLLHLLGGTVERWAVRHLELDLQTVRSWWRNWAESPQMDVQPVCASVLAYLPLTLRQLDVSSEGRLRDGLRAAESAQRKREQAQPGEAIGLEQAMTEERKALEALAALIDEPTHQAFLWKRVRELMRRYGYSEESVLLELAQNADDALAQAVEIQGRQLPEDACRLTIEVNENGGAHTLDVIHYGRPVNDTGGAAFPQGRERQWDQDLYYMMLMNLSAKPGETPGQSSEHATTGRFGLGFKSIHFLSSHPTVVSGFIAFSISAGLLPKEEPIPSDDDMPIADGRRGTRIRLPLHSKQGPNELLESTFRRFDYARVFLPAFARQIREVIVTGPSPIRPGRHLFDGECVGALGWSLSAEMDLLDTAGHWQLLRFRPSDTGDTRLGTLALVVGVRDGVPTPLPKEVPFLWNVVPTSESWGCGYAVNGPFKLDPGRTHVSLDDEVTCRAIHDLGEALGKELIALHDAYVDRPGGRCFLGALWQILASGLDSQDTLRRQFIHRLHGSGLGLSAWMNERGVVPSGLKPPFATTLPALTPDLRIGVVASALEGADWCRALDQIARQDAQMAALLKDRSLVSVDVAKLLRPLDVVRGLDPVTSCKLTPEQVLAELFDRWDYQLTPERLHALRPLAEEELLSPHDSLPHNNMVARSADGESHRLQFLLVPKELGNHWPRCTDFKDECMRSVFAPQSRVLDSAYLESDEDWRVYRWLRGQHRVDAVMIAGWYSDLAADDRLAAIRYLMHGQLKSEVLEKLLADRPSWLGDYKEVQAFMGELGEDSWRCKALLASLFPDRVVLPAPPSPNIALDEVQQTFFRKLLKWWGDEKTRRAILSKYECKAWPAELRGNLVSGLRDGSKDHWLALLTLGANQSLGRTQDEQHRGFIELAKQEGWWQVFLEPDDDRAWMGVLRTWQDHAVEDLQYRLWMSLFPTIFQFSRYMDQYRNLLLSSVRRPEHLYSAARILAPRADDALSGAGSQFDAPPAPLNIGFHWVLRELVRLNVIRAEHLFPDCWVPAAQVVDLLKQVGLDLAEITDNQGKARAVFEFLERNLDPKWPHLHFCFDIPLRYVAEHSELRIQFGLEA